MRNFILILLLFVSLISFAQTDIEQIIEDIYATAIEDGRTIELDELTSTLHELAVHPINLNQATEKDLERMLFLTYDQIDDILFYVYEHPFESTKELLLIRSLKDYDVRNLLPFVVAGEPKKDKLEAYEVFRYSKQELDIRADARQIENNAPDPFYLHIKYKFNFSNQIQLGLRMEHDVAEPWFSPKKTFGFDYYGGYCQLNDISKHVQTIVLGDFRASFGQGLVVNNALDLEGKQSFTSRKGVSQEGLKKYGGLDEYHFFRGAGTTLLWKFDKVSHSLSAFYSAKKVDANVNNNCFPSIVQTGYHRTETELAHKREEWQQVAGVNYTLTGNRFRVGFTAIENVFLDTLMPKPTYYNTNYFTGKQQFVAGINYNYLFSRFILFGEVAVAENSKWGVANITGLSCKVAQDTRLTLLYRYFSPHFDNLFASAFGESSRINDENGLYLGTEVKNLHNWVFSAYVDGWYFAFPKSQIKTSSAGWDVFAQAKYYANNQLEMNWRVRAKHKGNLEKYAFHYQLIWQNPNWRLKTLVDANMTADKHYGLLIMQELKYSFSKVPLSLQLVLSGFDAKNYDNRIYAYESDVLYAFSLPMTYGVGGKWNFNLCYKPCKQVALYLKVGEFLYAKSWQNQHNLIAPTATDVHFLVHCQF